MSWLPQFAAWQYALAGLVCALGPIIIHWLSRQRHTVIAWGAMELLQEAVASQQRLLRLRNLLLLALRVAAVLLFGLALARPFSSRQATPLSANTPRHLILLVDNSLSMSYRTTQGTLLEQAQQRGSELFRSLPRGSRASVIPICADPSWQQQLVAADPADAMEQLRSVQVVDGACRFEQLMVAARHAVGHAEPLRDQLVLLSDMQRINWDVDQAVSQLADLPVLYVEDLGVRHPSNSWVEDVRLIDEVMCPHAAATAIAVLGHDGNQDRQVVLSLAIDERIVVSRSVPLVAGTRRHQVALPFRVQDTVVSRGGVRFAHLRVSLTPDRLAQDDERHLLLPVVNRLPVVFVDPMGDGREDVRSGNVGETWPLRQLLVPPMTGHGEQTQLIEVRHLTMASLNPQRLADARLVVVAGVPQPAGQTELLREYVAQGGSLLLAAGGMFDAAAWNDEAWREGRGLLPGPLSTARTDGVRTLRDFPLEGLSINVPELGPSSVLQLPGVPQDGLAALYAEPVFLRAVELELDATTRAAVLQAEIAAIRRRIGQLPQTGLADPPAGPADSPGADWLTWHPPLATLGDWPADPASLDRAIQDQAEHALPIVHARLAGTDGLPLVVERRMGRGRVFFWASGFLPAWTTLSQTNAVVLLDRIVRELVLATLPQRNFTPQARLPLELPNVPIGGQVLLQRPGASAAGEYLDTAYVGRRPTGVIIPAAWERGIYRLQLTERVFSVSAEEDLLAPAVLQREIDAWRIAVNGDAAESDLTPLRADERERLADSGQVAWLAADGLSAEQPLGPATRTWWRILVTMVLLLLLGELTILAWSRHGTAGP